MDDNERELYLQIEKNFELFERHGYEEYIRAKYPAVAEAYQTYMVLFSLAKEQDQRPNVAKAV